MNTHTSHYVLAGSIIIFLVLAAFFLYPRLSHAPVSTIEQGSRAETIAIEVNGATIVAEVVKKMEDLQLGLSGRESLAEGRGMWFDFGYADRWGIWMKDMKFPIDIVWLDKTLTVVSIEASVAPETYPKAFYPSHESLYVLEIPAGAVEKYRIAVGNQVSVR